MHTPGLFKGRACWDCGRLICHPGCPGAPEPPEPEEDPHADAPEALGWRPATAEDLYPLPRRRPGSVEAEGCPSD